MAVQSRVLLQHFRNNYRIGPPLPSVNGLYKALARVFLPPTANTCYILIGVRKLVNGELGVMWGLVMKVKSLSLYADFLSFFRKRTVNAQKYVTFGDMRLSFKLLNTAALSAESKLTYAYLFHKRYDTTGVTVPGLSNILGIQPGLVRQSLKELEQKKHICLITAQPKPDQSAVVYYYNIVDQTRYGMLNTEASGNT